MRSFPRMVEVVPEGERGTALVEHFEFTEQESRFTRMRAALGHPHEFCPPGRYARLRVGGQIWMTDTPMEHESNQDVLDYARGEVLVGGLGLGMVVAGLLRTPAVKRITVVEDNPDVIALVEPALQRWGGLDRADVFHVEQGDIFTTPTPATNPSWLAPGASTRRPSRPSSILPAKWGKLTFIPRCDTIVMWR